MAHGINDHVPVGASVAVPADFLNKVLDLLHPIHAHAVASLEDRALPPEVPAQVSAAPQPGFSDAQFARLEELLAPLHHLAKLALVAHDDEKADAGAIDMKPAAVVVHTGERSASEQSSG